MQFGSFMEFHCRPGESQAQSFSESFEQVDLAEELGLDSVWLAESHFSPARSVLSSPLILAAAIAARTERLRVGTSVHVLPLGNPLRIAEQAATLDHVSGGRFDFGVGRSGLPGAYEGYNIPYGESRERFYEYLDVIIQAWTNERFSYEGKYCSFDDVCLVPKPYQSPHPPIRIAATTPDTFPVIAKMGYPVFIGVRGQGMSQVAEQVDDYKRAWKDAGHEGPADVSLRVPVFVADSKEEALSVPEESFMKQFRRLGAQLASSVTRAGTDPREQRAERGEELAVLTWEEVQKEKVAVGTPEMVIEQLHKMQDTLSLSGVVAELNAGELIPADKIARSLQLLCEKVMPAFK